ncbi:MAG: hypothetical protein FWD26_06090 [Treponema sp.]|nr:hypothetical protein [Treponema sp.]
MKNTILFLLLLPIFLGCASLDSSDYITLPDGTMADKRIPQEIIDLVINRFEAIESGNIEAFRETLPEMQDGVDYYSQLALLHRYFGEAFGIDTDTFINAVETSDGLREIAQTLFTGKLPARNRSPLILKRIDVLPDNEIKLIVVNEKNEKVDYDFTYYFW